jgi:hypothetical protein
MNLFDNVVVVVVVDLVLMEVVMGDHVYVSQKVDSQKIKSRIEKCIESDRRRGVE